MAKKTSPVVNDASQDNLDDLLGDEPIGTKPTAANPSGVVGGTVVKETAEETAARKLAEKAQKDAAKAEAKAAKDAAKAEAKAAKDAAKVPRQIKGTPVSFTNNAGEVITGHGVLYYVVRFEGKLHYKEASRVTVLEGAELEAYNAAQAPAVA